MESDSRVPILVSREHAAPQKIMDVGGNGSGLPVNNKQRAMLPNKGRGEFTRNQRKDSEVRTQKSDLFLRCIFSSTDEAFPAASVTLASSVIVA